MKKPKILLSGKKNLQHYADAVNGTGGIADAGYLPALRDDYDGLVLCGGNDINPAYYNEIFLASSLPTLVRHTVLRRFVNFEEEKNILAIKLQST